MRVIVDRNACEANALCVTSAPDVFDIDDNDELAVLDEHPAEDRRTAVRHAVMACPKQALRLLDD
jgi:ferredoxin